MNKFFIYLILAIVMVNHVYSQTPTTDTVKMTSVSYDLDTKELQFRLDGKDYAVNKTLTNVYVILNQDSSLTKTGLAYTAFVVGTNTLIKIPSIDLKAILGTSNLPNQIQIYATKTPTSNVVFESPSIDFSITSVSSFIDISNPTPMLISGSKIENLKQYFIETNGAFTDNTNACTFDSSSGEVLSCSLSKAKAGKVNIALSVPGSNINITTSVVYQFAVATFKEINLDIFNISISQLPSTFQFSDMKLFVGKTQLEYKVLDTNSIINVQLNASCNLHYIILQWKTFSIRIDHHFNPIILDIVPKIANPAVLTNITGLYFEGKNRTMTVDGANVIIVFFGPRIVQFYPPTLYLGTKNIYVYLDSFKSNIASITYGTGTVKNMRIDYTTSPFKYTIHVRGTYFGSFGNGYNMFYANTTTPLPYTVDSNTYFDVGFGMTSPNTKEIRSSEYFYMNTTDPSVANAFTTNVYQFWGEPKIVDTQILSFNSDNSDLYAKNRDNSVDKPDRLLVSRGYQLFRSNDKGETILTIKSDKGYVLENCWNADSYQVWNDTILEDQQSVVCCDIPDDFSARQLFFTNPSFLIYVKYNNSMKTIVSLLSCIIPALISLFLIIV